MTSEPEGFHGSPTLASVSKRISYSQNGEDVRIWHAFGPRAASSDRAPFTYVDVGANEPWHYSVTAALYELGWRGLLVEADPTFAQLLRDARPEDSVVEAAAAAEEGALTFYRVPGTGLGTLDAREAEVAQSRGFEVESVSVPARPLDSLVSEFQTTSHVSDVHVMTIDVEGAESQVLSGMAFTSIRPWVLCIEAVDPGSSIPSHEKWEPTVLKHRYRFVAFDGINRWYVAEERADLPGGANAGAPPGTTIAQAIAVPFHALDIGEHGWVTEELDGLRDRDNRSYNRAAWQRELILHQTMADVPRSEYERQIAELRSALIQVEGSRTFALSKRLSAVGKKVVHLGRRMRNALPSPIADRIVRERHLRHVSVNMRHLTDPAYLDEPPPDEVTWIATGVDGTSERVNRPPLPPGLGLTSFNESEATKVREWLANYPFDDDHELDSRMDNHDDEVGRVRAALRTRLQIASPPADLLPAKGHRVAIDARALQSPAFGKRGIGRFAQAALMGLRESVEDEHITLIIDRGLMELPDDIAGSCTQATWITQEEVSDYGVLIEPSPMTHSVDPLLPLLQSDALTVAIVFDFIPLHYPTVYLRHAAARAEYGAALDALKLYKDFVCISHGTRDELDTVLGSKGNSRPHSRSTVAWPRDVLPAGELSGVREQSVGTGPIVLMTGDEPRKNTFGGLAGIAAATTQESERNVVVVGMAGQNDRVHHWSIAAAMRPGEARNLERIDDAELAEALAAAACVVVPSFDEGLSLPVIEAVRSGTPVVTSSIPSHRELVGSGSFSCDPANPRSIARAIRRTRGNARVRREQARNLRRHSHEDLEAVIARTVKEGLGSKTTDPRSSSGEPRARSERLSIGVATPWDPQRTGVADFSTQIFTELAALADVTVYTTAGAAIADDTATGTPIIQRSIEEAFADPVGTAARHDAFISVVGNSHYHLPFVEILRHIDAIAVAHDTRMVEFYMALRGKGGVENLMLRTCDASAPARIAPPLDEQIDDMRLLQNAGFWEIARRSRSLILHSPSAAPRIERETGRKVAVLPFANQRVPTQETVTSVHRSAARERLGLSNYPATTIHLGSFGYVDPRTKMVDVVLESAAWLQQWGHSVALHLIGSASSEQERELTERAEAAGLEHFQITGFQTEEQFRDWLLAVDLGLQLRVSSLLGVSGPLSDLAAFGTPAIASNGLCIDVDTPEYIHRLPDAVSPVIVAEAVEYTMAHPFPPDRLEAMRRNYLDAKSPVRYVQLLLEQIESAL